MNEYRYYLIDFTSGDAFNTKIYTPKKHSSEGFMVRTGVDRIVNGIVINDIVYDRVQAICEDLSPPLLQDKIALNLYLLFQDQSKDELLIDLMAFKQIFGYGDKYKSFSDFKTKVMLPAIANLAENSAIDCSVFKLNRNTLLFQLSTHGQRQSA